MAEDEKNPPFLGTSYVLENPKFDKDNRVLGEPEVPVIPVAHAMQQGDRVKGYRKMSEEELALFNEGKELALLVGAYVKKLEMNYQVTVGGPMRSPVSIIPGTRPCDQRWIAIGKTDLQRGFMAIYRGIAQPEGF